MISERIRAMTGLHWLILFAAILLAWAGLFAMALNVTAHAGHLHHGSGGFWASFHNATPDAVGFLRVFAMWGLMSAAMMAPTALPAFATYDDLSHATQTRFGHLVAGYLVVWLGFSAVSAIVQIALFQSQMIDRLGASRSGILSAGLLTAAGLYQFSALKEACLSKCRQPMTFFMSHFDEGPWRNGLRLGLACLGCCWALMLLGFVGGVMNMAFMGLAMVIMILEKLPEIGRILTRPLGVALLAGAAWVAFGSMT